ncbi:MAG: molybdate ABC transporter permease subunit, partial [Deltaproteobacteria bacterium]|nr:molybdate ABC transporter permease subunit [Deltaproteobacteria bacterium]
MIDLFPLYLTLKVSIVATFFSIIIGLCLAWLMARKDFFGKGILDALVMQPIVIPPTVLGYYLLVLLGRSSPFGRILEDT